MKKQKSSSNLYCQSHKSSVPFEKRYLEYKHLRNKFPSEVPLVFIVINDDKSISEHKVLASKEKSLPDVLDEMADIIGKHEVTIETKERSYKLEDVVQENDSLLSDVYKKCKDTDGFMYVVAY